MNFLDTLIDIETIVSQEGLYTWGEREAWGISKGAWDLTKGRRLCPLRLFAHPKIIIEHPQVVSYYRNVASVPVACLHPTQGVGSGINPHDALKLARKLNRHVSALIEAGTPCSSRHKLAATLFSWSPPTQLAYRKRLDQIAAGKVMSYIVGAFMKKGMLASVIDKSGKPLPIDPDVDYVSCVFDYRGFKLNNKRSVLFGSEPDISILAEDGAPLCAIEVKGGTDPAGALERLGAIKKSFQHAISQNKKVHTILVVSCITKEMEKRLKRDRAIQEIFNLTVIVNDMDERANFLRKLEVFLHPPERQP
ncbi:MAG: XcyI family restriction endonuclease [Planctomycetota bacterium]